MSKERSQSSSGNIEVIKVERQEVSGASQNFRTIAGITDTITTSSLGLGGSQDFQFKSKAMESELNDLRMKINLLENKLNHNN